MSSNPWISAIGFVTPAGHESESILKAISEEPVDRTIDEYALKDFNPAKHLSNRRMMKNVAKYHGYGMAAIEFMKRAANWSGEDHDPFRAGLFVGAPPASVMDHSNYVEPIRRAREMSHNDVEHEFGATCMGTLGTTLLTGLPNNVLCNGAIILNAKGKNDNYVMGETGAHYSLASAARSLRLEGLDIGFAGGFSYHTDPVMTGMYKKTGHIGCEGEMSGRIRPYSECSKTIFGDGAVFVSIESEESARSRGINQPLAEFVDLIHSSFAAGPFSDDFADAAKHVTRKIGRSLDRSEVKAEDIGLVYLSGAGIPPRDDLELDVLEQLFGGLVDKPAVATISAVTGNLMEASGLLELATIGPAYSDGAVPVGMRLTQEPITSKGFSHVVNQEKPYVLILRHSVWADQLSCLLVKRPGVDHG